jgi:hypothetical protein
MTRLRIAIAVALMLCMFIPVSAALARDLQCTLTVAQYNEAIGQLEILAAKARAQADENPLSISDERYYVSVLADAKQCLKTATPVTTAAR